jgi:hypothetical protein
MAAFTYGPITGDLVALAKPGPELINRLGRSLGLEWVASLVEIDRPRGLGEATLTRYLRGQFGLKPGFAPNPFAVRRGNLVRQRMQTVPTALLADFASEEYGRLELIGKAIRPLVTPLLAVATGRPWRIRDQQERASVLFNALEPPLKLRSMLEPALERRTYSLEFPNLYARALLEIIELYDDRPRLSICSRCGRLFAPDRKAQKYCGRYTWHWRGGEPIGGCIVDGDHSARRAELDAQSRRREYMRLQMRVSRHTKAHGQDDSRTKQAVREFNAWKKSNPSTLGRRPNPVNVELIP